MDVLVEFLERDCEGMINTCEDIVSLKQLFEDERIARAELKEQLVELMVTVRNQSPIDHGSSNCDHAKRQNHDYCNRDWDAKWRKLEIPIFDGEDAFGWTNKVKRYFEIKGVEEED